MKYILLFLMIFNSLSFISDDRTEKERFSKIPDQVEKSQANATHYDHLIIRGGFLIDGTGAPATGPVDIEIEGNRITKITSVGTPGISIKSENRPKLKKSLNNVREIDAHGKYILPGFIDSHTHIHSPLRNQKVSADYIFKLWLGHGVTSVREVFGLDGESRLLALKELSNRNAITAPRINA